jgi:hypothetical protein
MDLAKVVQKDEVEVELFLPNGVALVNDDGSKMTISLSGVYSSKYREVVEAQQATRLKKMQRMGGKPTIDPKEVRDSRTDLLVQCTLSWNITLNGECPECNEKNTRSIYNSYPFIRDQVSDALEEPQAFLED